MLIKNILLESLEELSDKELQEKLWLHGDENGISSFTEACCGLFDDAGLSRAVETGYLEKYFSKELCHKVDKLEWLLDKISEYLPEEEIIKHPKMDEVRVLSGELLALFKNELWILGSNK
jgi:hypothetical protein